MNDSYFRIMALDYGDKRIGIALTDITRTIASPFKTYTRVNVGKDMEYLTNLIKEQKVKIIVFGLPLNMDGSSGARVQKTQDFANKLAKLTDVKLEYVDERLTSVYAEEIMHELGVAKSKKKENIDKLAAQIILNAFMDMYKGE